MNECQTPDCRTICEAQKHLCTACIRDLQAWIDKGRPLIPELNVTIARLDAVRPGNVEGGNGSKSAGSSAPLDITALQVQMDLQEDTRYTAEQYAADPWAASETTRVIENIQHAELMISGPEDDKPTKAKILSAAADLRHQVPEELPVPALVEWLNDIHKMDIKRARIWQWAKRGHITRTNETGQARYSPAAVLIHARRDNLERLDKAAKGR